MTTELLIALQFIMVFFIATVMLTLILLRQKKTISQLKQILLHIKGDISGDNLTSYLEQEMHNTASHCQQDTVTLKPDLPAEDMAIALRHRMLQVELEMAANHVPDQPETWDKQISPYLDLANQITSLIKDRVNNATKTLNESHNVEMKAKQNEVDTLAQEAESLFKQVEALSPLENLFLKSEDHGGNKIELEQKLHKALLALCENYSNSEEIREVIFLIHESYHAAEMEKEQTNSLDSTGTD